MIQQAFSQSTFICSEQELAQKGYHRCAILFKKQPQTAILFSFQDRIYGYLNHCMHMNRQLDCHAESIFSEDGKLLRCSMHGFVFEPTTGECLSPVCAGEKLQALKLAVVDGQVFFSDKRVQYAVTQ